LKRRLYWLTLVSLAGLTSLLCFTALGQQEVSVTGQIDFGNKTGSRAPDSSNAVVWLTPAGNAPQKQTVALQRQQFIQKNKSFVPHLLVVQVGSSVDFPNQDPFFHNVFSLFDGKRFDLGLYEAGSTRSVVFNKVGVSYIFCNIHPEMSAVVIAVKTPYYGISDKKGALNIPQVPPGRYEMQVWHERVLPETLSTLTRSIVISSGSSSLGTIRLPEQRNTSELHKNKYGEDYDTPATGSPVYPRP